MACFSPVPAWPDLITGEWVFNWSPKRELGERIDTKCRQCIGCRLDYSAEWALRAEHEARFHSQSMFLTLTHDDASFPVSQAAWQRENDLFIKRLRKAAGVPIRTFGCLELGEKSLRPHSHYCVFGFSFERERKWGKGGAGHQLYRAQALDDLWPLGIATFGALTRESAAYTARYSMKKRSTRDARGEFVEVPHPVSGVVIPFRPAMPFARSKGLGRRWFEAHGEQALHIGACVSKGGRRSPIPTYYLKLAKLLFPGVGADAQCAALEHVAATAWNRTPERLAVREEVQAARTRTLSRSL